MAFMGMLRVLSLSPELPGQSSRKVSSFFRHDRRIYGGVLDPGERRLPGCSRNDRNDQYPRKEKG